MTLQLLHSEFPYIWGKSDYLFISVLYSYSTDKIAKRATFLQTLEEAQTLTPLLANINRQSHLHCIKSELYLAKWKWILRSGPKLKMLVKFHRSNGSFPNPLNWWWIRFGCTALDQCYWNKENWFAKWKSTMHFSDLHILASTRCIQN